MNVPNLILAISDVCQDEILMIDIEKRALSRKEDKRARTTASRGLLPRSLRLKFILSHVLVSDTNLVNILELSDLEILKKCFKYPS